MKRYKRCPEVELLDISGEHLLVATGKAREHCHYATQINRTAADYWKLINQPYSINELAEKIAEYNKTETKKVILNVLIFVNKMKKCGYLIEVEE